MATRVSLPLIPDDRGFLVRFRSVGGTYTHLQKVFTKYELLKEAIVDGFEKITDSRLRSRLLRAGNVMCLEVEDIQVLTLLDQGYPEEFWSLDVPPIVIWYKGNMSLFSSPRIGIVGSRVITTTTQAYLRAVVPELGNAGLTVVSGLALGVDAYAQEQVIRAGNQTIAVLGGGLDMRSMSPKSHLALYTTLINEGHLVISEYTPGTVPTRYTFPERNRLVAALSSSLLVAQAGGGSGSMITAGLMHTLNKPVITPSVDYFAEVFVGNRQLISQGAHVSVSSQDILDTYYPEAQPLLPVITSMTTKEMDFVKLCGFFGLAKGAELAEITKLELQGVIEQTSSGTWLVRLDNTKKI